VREVGCGLQGGGWVDFATRANIEMVVVDGRVLIEAGR
jgi:hypothetical protein